jgi:hypothetical protein
VESGEVPKFGGVVKFKRNQKFKNPWVCVILMEAKNPTLLPKKIICFLTQFREI